MAGLVPAIHVFLRWIGKAWITGTSPVMTDEGRFARSVSAANFGSGLWHDGAMPPSRGASRCSSHSTSLRGGSTQCGERSLTCSWQQKTHSSPGGVLQANMRLRSAHHSPRSGQAGPCPTDAAPRAAPREPFVKRRYAGTRTLVRGDCHGETLPVASWFLPLPWNRMTS